jgi:hypothetical protein
MRITNLTIIGHPPLYKKKFSEISMFPEVSLAVENGTCARILMDFLVKPTSLSVHSGPRLLRRGPTFFIDVQKDRIYSIPRN